MTKTAKYIFEKMSFNELCINLVNRGIILGSNVVNITHDTFLGKSYVSYTEIFMTSGNIYSCELLVSERGQVEVFFYDNPVKHLNKSMICGYIRILDKIAENNLRESVNKHGISQKDIPEPILTFITTDSETGDTWINASYLTDSGKQSNMTSVFYASGRYEHGKLIYDMEVVL